MHRLLSKRHKDGSGRSHNREHLRDTTNKVHTPIPTRPPPLSRVSVLFLCRDGRQAMLRWPCCASTSSSSSLTFAPVPIPEQAEHSEEALLLEKDDTDSSLFQAVTTSQERRPVAHSHQAPENKFHGFFSTDDPNTEEEEPKVCTYTPRSTTYNNEVA